MSIKFCIIFGVMVNFYLDWVLDFVKALQTLYMNSEARKLLMAIYFNQKKFFAIFYLIEIQLAAIWVVEDLNSLKYIL